MEFKFCPTCGNKNTRKDIGDDANTPYCETCKRPWFPFSYTCVLVLVVDEKGNFAFIQQNYIREGLYIGVAGYPNHAEPYEETVKREVYEEIGLEANHVQYVHSYYYEKRDLMMLGFVAKVNHGEFKLSKEVDAAKWFAPEEAEAALPQGSIVHSLYKDYVCGRNTPKVSMKDMKDTHTCT